MNTLSGVLKKSGKDIFHNIIDVVAISLIASLIVFPGLFILPPGLGLVYMLLTAGPALFAAFYAIDMRITGRPFKYSLFFKGFKAYYGRAVVIGLLFTILSVIPASSWWYYTKERTMFTLIIAMFQSYIYLMLLVALTYIVPIMIKENVGLSHSLKTSFRLFLDNPTYTIGSSVQIISVTLLLALTVVSFPMLFPGMFSVFALNLYDNLLLKYEEKKEQ
jgi:uncharacterized membrane protein YesL